MTFQTVKLMPGVHEVQTPLLLQAGIAKSNFVRFRDGLPEKIGGWARLPNSPSLPGPVRELWAWADFDSVVRIAAGGDSGLYVIEPQQGGSFDLGPSQYLNLTPYWNVSASVPPANFATTTGSNVVTITDAGSDVTIDTGITIQNPISIGGLILSGAYSIDSAQSSGVYTVSASTNATATATSGTCATFATTAGSAIVTVTLTAHGLSAGKAYSVDLPVTVGGITLSGAYTVLSVVDANNFTIGAANQATATASVVQNGGNVSILYWLGQPPLPPGGGWGVGAWGLGSWGQSQPPPALPAGAKRLTSAAMPWGSGANAMGLDWDEFNFGEQLIAQPEGGPIFFWDPHSGLLQTEVISQGPQASTGIFLAMPQQQIVAYGASTGTSESQDLMLVRWCDNADYTDWTASASNQAGSYRLTRGSRIIGGMQGPQQAMLWTDVGLWLMQYIGYPDVWGFNEIAQGCGLMSKKAAGVVAGVVYWMGIDGFWRYAGQGVQRIPCEVWDVVYQNVFRGPANVHIRCAPNTNQNEIAWFFPSITGGGAPENTTFVKLNVLTGEWDYGYVKIADQYDYGFLTEWLDANVYGEPLSAMRNVGADTSTTTSTDSLIMQHETGLNQTVGGGCPQPINDANGVSLNWWFETGLFALAEGEQFQFIDRMFPDMKWARFSGGTKAAIAVTLKGYRFPEATPDLFGPFLMTAASNEVDPRARGRYFSLRVEGNDIGTFARLGAFKFRFAPDGRN